MISAYKPHTMYQSIDDDATTAPDAPDTPQGRLRPVLAALALGSVLITGLYVVSTGSDGSDVRVETEPESRAAYMRALSESKPALRRARLTDFLNQHPEDPRRNAVLAQLGVLDTVADTDWQATLTQAYDPRLPRSARRAAVTAYQQEWGRYLGARDSEIEAVLADIEIQPEPEDRPDRDLPKDPDRFAGIPDQDLAGGPGWEGRRFEELYGREAVIFRPSERLRETRTGTGEIVAPRVRRRVTPRYPRSAERRGVDAIVTLSLNIDASGRVAMVELIDVEADRYEDDFVRAAERAALRTRFYPQTLDGEPVPASNVRKRYRFEAD